MKFRLLWALLAPLFLNACAIPLRVPLTEPSRGTIQAAKAHVAIVQDEVIVDVAPSLSAGAGMMFGLVGAIVTTSIDSAVTNNRLKAAMAAVENFYPKIDDIDFRKDFGDAITRRQNDYPIKLTEVFTTPRGLTQPEIKKKTENLGPNEALLLVYPHYRLSGDYRYVFGWIAMTLWTKASDTHLYRGQAIYQSKAVGPGGPDSLALWSKDNAAAFRATLQEAAAELIDMAITDVNLDPNVKDGEVKTFPIGAKSIFLPPQAAGKVLSERNGRVRVLGKEGFHFSLPVASE